MKMEILACRPVIVFLKSFEIVIKIPEEFFSQDIVSIGVSMSDVDVQNSVVGIP